MEIQPVSQRMYALMILFDMHSTYFINAIVGISDEDAAKRLDTKANHIQWIAGSLVQERFELANLLGHDLKAEAHQLFANHQGIKDDAKYPTLASYRADWNRITPILRESLIVVNDAKLNEVIDFPEMSFPLYDMCSFNTYREASCIGQIALWRRLLGYGAMQYM
ncbi:hypothetical protein FQZ97_645500 [compost metagenome]